MQHIQGGDRNQTLLLPVAVDDYVGRENPVRFIEAFVDQCDLQEAGFRRVQPKDTGRPGYDPADLLKLYIYGYVNRVRSSRRLEAETARNLEVIWLLRGLRPDFKTIADFRKDNRHAFKPVFRQFVLLCRKLDLFGRELLAVDGTRLKAVNSTDRNFTREKLVKMIRPADERLADYLSRLDRTDAEEEGASGRPAKNLTEKIAALKERKTRHEGLLEELERSGESQVSLTDPDSRRDGRAPESRRGLQRPGRVRRQAQADRRATHHQCRQRPRPAGANRWCRQRGARRRAERRRRRQGLLQGRGHPGVRGRGHRGLRRPAAARVSGTRRVVSQGGVPLRPDQRHLSLPRRTATPSALSLRQGGPHDGAVLQSRCMPGL